MLYKNGGELEIDGHRYSRKIVNGPLEEKESINDGWKHKPVQGEGLDEQYKLVADKEAAEKENVELRAKIAEYEAMKAVNKVAPEVVEGKKGRSKAGK